MGLWGTSQTSIGEHFHGVNAAGAGQEDTQQPQTGTSLDDNYVLMPFDVTRDDVHSVSTEGASRSHIRSDAEAAEAIRAIPIEKVPASIFGG